MNESSPSMYVAPCPFCASVPEKDTASDAGGFFTTCEDDCILKTRIIYIGGKTYSLKAWNTREKYKRGSYFTGAANE